MNVLNVKGQVVSNIAITAVKISDGKMNKVMPDMKIGRECYSILTFQYIDA